MLVVKRNAKLGTSLTVAFVLFIVVPALLMTVVLISSFRNEEIANAALASDELLSQINQNAYEKAVTIENYIDQMSINPTIVEFLTYTTNDTARLSVLYEMFEEIDRYTSNSSFPGTSLQNMLIIGENGIFYRQNEMFYADVDALKQESWYQAATQSVGRTNWCGVITTLSNLNPGQSYLCISRTIRNSRTWQAQGTLLLAFDKNYFSSLLRSSSITGRISIYGDNRHLIGSICSDESLPEIDESIIETAFADSGSGSFNVSIGGEPFLCAYTAPNQMGWRTVRIIDLAELTGGALKNLPLMLGALCACMLVFGGFLIFSYRRIIRPLQYLANLFNEMELMGEIDINRLRSLELSTIGASVITLVNKKRETDTSLVSVRQQKEFEELKRIQAQLNPHFLYNILDNMAVLASNSSCPDMAGLLGDLRVIMRNMMSRQNDFVSVSDELNALESYMRIENIVYQDSISFELNIAPDVLNLRIAGFLLQPIVENSIQHGINPTQRGGRIAVSAYRADGTLLLTVRDNGRGMTDEQLSAIRAQKEFSAQSSSSMSGLGFLGVHRKLQLIYGMDYGLDIASSPDSGTVVTVRLPIVEEVRDGD